MHQSVVGGGVTSTSRPARRRSCRDPARIIKDAREDLGIFRIFERDTEHRCRIIRAAPDTDHHKNRDTVRPGVGIVSLDLVRGCPFHDGAIDLLAPVKSGAIFAFDGKFLVCRYIADNEIRVGVGLYVDALTLVVVVSRPVADGEVVGSPGEKACDVCLEARSFLIIDVFLFPTRQPEVERL